MKQVSIDTEYITLGQMLKLTDCISTGGQTKTFLAETEIRVNEIPENRRGRKLYRGDRISVKGHGDFTIV